MSSICAICKKFWKFLGKINVFKHICLETGTVAQSTSEQHTNTCFEDVRQFMYQVYILQDNIENQDELNYQFFYLPQSTRSNNLLTYH